MGTIVSLDEYRRKRCLSALLEEIGLPGFCQECDDRDLDYLLTDDGALVPVLPVEAPLHAEPALIIDFERRAVSRGRRKTGSSASRL
jgi:hypothetical protein